MAGLCQLKNVVVVSQPSESAIALNHSDKRAEALPQAAGEFEVTH